jgi:L-alanine-DL-glutamate epimerase-like enolase superfamily enzyme
VFVVESVLRELLVGKDPSDVEGLWAQMYRATLPFGRKGLAIMAISAIDLALWDLAGKVVEKPVYELLGGLRHDVIPAYASGGHVVTDEVKQSFRHVKLHMPDFSGDIDETIDIVRQARQRTGPDVKLYVDAFLKWDVETTVRLADAFVPYGVEWIEEPLSPDDLDGYTQLVRRSPIPIAGGEHEYVVSGFRELLDRQAHSIL